MMNEKGIQWASSNPVKIGLYSYFLQEFESTLYGDVEFYNALKWTACYNGIRNAHVQVCTLRHFHRTDVYSHLTCAST